MQFYGESSNHQRTVTTIFGLPFIDVAFSPDPEKDEVWGHAYGIIAVGDVATGLIAIGGLAKGVLAIGGVSFGGDAFGKYVISGMQNSRKALTFFSKRFPFLPLR